MFVSTVLHSLFFCVCGCKSMIYLFFTYTKQRLNYTHFAICICI